VDNGADVAAGFPTVVVVSFRKPLLVGDKKLKMKAASMPRPASTERIFARTDQRVRESSVGGGGGGAVVSGAGP